MQLELYISDLLYRYQCVTVPGFGAFLTERVSAKIHHETHTFYPPKKVLSFNEQLQHNDGLLVNYVSEVEKIPYKTASLQIDKQVASMKAYLKQGDTIHLEHVGDLMLNTEDKIVFSPSQHINYLTDAFGLAYFNTDKIKRIGNKKNFSKVEKNKTIALKNQKRNNNNFTKYAAAAVLIFGLSSMVYYSYKNQQLKEHNAIAEQEANLKLEAQIQEATFVIPNPLPHVTLTISKPARAYHVVGGAFRIKSNSEKKIAELISKGYNARSLGKNRFGLHQVVYGSYTKKIEALQALKNIKASDNPEAWLLYKPMD